MPWEAKRYRLHMFTEALNQTGIGKAPTGIGAFLSARTRMKSLVIWLALVV